MSEYHNQAAYQRRLAKRRASPVPITNLAVFFHITLMPRWEPILAEQFRLIAHAGLKEVKSVLLGPSDDIDRCLRIAARYGVSVEVLGRDTDISCYEGPTLREVHKWAKDNRDGAVIYLHTKGVSSPDDDHKRHWRRVMMKYVVAQWRENLKILEHSDLVGCGWQADRNYPHYCGNFWGARCDWLASLRDPETYRNSRPDFRWAGHLSWKNRFYVETWIASEGFHHVHAHLGRGARLWTEDVRRMDAGIANFSYLEPLYLGREDALRKRDPDGVIAITHAGKIGDALYALPVAKWLCEQHGGCKADFYSMSKFAAMAPLIEHQPYIRKFVSTPDGGCTDPNTDGAFCFWNLPVSGDDYLAVYHLGYRQQPVRFLVDHIAESVSAPDGLPVHYDAPAPADLPPGPFVAVAPSPRNQYRGLLTEFIQRCPYPVVQVGGAGEEVEGVASGVRTSASFLDMAAILSRCRWFVGTPSAPLAVANGFTCHRLCVHDGNTETRHLMRSGRNHYLQNPTVEEILNRLGEV